MKLTRLPHPSPGPRWRWAGHGLVALALWAAAIAYAATAAPLKSITVAVSDNSPPWVFRDADGHLQGLGVDRWSLWEAATGIKVNLRAVTYRQAKDLLLAGKVDAIDFVSNADVEKDQLDLSDAYMPSNLVLYFHKSISGIVDAKSTRGFLVGVRRGGVCPSELREGGSYNLAPYPSFVALVDAALDGDVKVFCLPDQQAAYLLNRAGKAAEFRRSPPLRSLTAHWAVRKGNAAMKTLIAAGFARVDPAARQAVFDRWLGSSVDQPPVYLRHLAEALVVAAITLLVLLAWLWTLRRAVKRRTADLLAAKRDLAARVREQACLHGVFKASEDLNTPLRVMLHDVADALRTGLACADAASVEVDWDGQHHATGTAQNAGTRLSAPLLAEGQTHGQLTVTYDPPRASADDRTVHDQARGLLDLVAQRLATVFERRALQDERRELDRQMFQMEKLTTMGELTMGLAHEIGNPLGGMKAVAQSLQHEAALPDDVHEDLARLEAEIDRLSAFLRSFHGYAAQQAPAPEACALERILDDVLFWTRRDARSGKVRFEVAGLDTLPPLRADRHQLKQVLLNLVMNAIHALPEGGTVAIRAARAGATARLEVADSGAGIAPELLTRIFEPFFTTRRDGSGLGLPIVRKIVEDHGGSVSITSEPGRGTRVTLIWPLAIEDHDPIDPAR
ncbi:transporter substrate-binding domain-containing protein [Nitrogeniibacter mangrovi]|uniref:histidine kinase n=1 Tax=Nitrogeniibacter mangrovi TaxID=2016596 RepID=A0A6C1B097_9RHOO|nr:ATP-binding protein [Nitrogeniibacter mangrovi]QID16238.1 transporter substrate-binding domain-containing protein [Nitrogeniibacter mangrovi]